MFPDASPVPPAALMTVLDAVPALAEACTVFVIIVCDPLIQPICTQADVSTPTRSCDTNGNGDAVFAGGEASAANCCVRHRKRIDFVMFLTSVMQLLYPVSLYELMLFVLGANEYLVVIVAPGEMLYFVVELRLYHCRNASYSVRELLVSV